MSPWLLRFWGGDWAIVYVLQFRDARIRRSADGTWHVRDAANQSKNHQFHLSHVLYGDTGAVSDHCGRIGMATRRSRERVFLGRCSGLSVGPVWDHDSMQCPAQ